MAGIFLIGTIVLLSGLAVIFENAGIIVIGTIGLFILMGMSRILGLKIYPHMMISMTAAIIFMAGLYWLMMEKYGVPYYHGGSDDLLFEQKALECYEDKLFSVRGITEKEIPNFGNAKGYLIFLVWLMKFADLFGGYHTILPRLLNIYVLIGLGMLVYQYGKRHGGKNSIAIFYLITLFPNAVYISSHVFRDTLIAALLFGMFDLWDWYSDSRYFRQLCRRKITFKSAAFLFLTAFVSLIMIRCAYLLRTQTVYMMILIMLICLFIKSSISFKNFMFYIGCGVCGFLFLAYFKGFEVTKKFIDIYTSYRSSIPGGISAKIFSYPLLPVGAALRVIYGLSCPFPAALLELGGGVDDFEAVVNAFISLGTILQLFLLPFFLGELRKMDRLVLCFGVIYLPIVLTTFTFRHFITLYPFLFLLIFRGIHDRKERTRYSLIAMSGIPGAFLTLFYLIIKM